MTASGNSGTPQPERGEGGGDVARDVDGAEAELGGKLVRLEVEAGVARGGAPRRHPR